MVNHKMVRYMKLLVICVAVAGLPGCTEPPTRFPVAGTVTIDGKPLPTGSIQFVPANGRPVAGKILSDGSFRLDVQRMPFKLDKKQVLTLGTLHRKRFDPG